MKFRSLTTAEDTGRLSGVHRTHEPRAGLSWISVNG